MSKLAELLQAAYTNNVRVGQELQMDYTKTNFEYQSSPDFHSRDYEVRVNVSFGSKGWVTYSDYIKDGDLSSHYVVKNIKRGVIEEVFGEFRPSLYKLRTALYDRNFDEARQILNQLEYDMFTVEGE
jgi:hypothetical protein